MRVSPHCYIYYNIDSCYVKVYILIIHLNNQGYARPMPNANIPKGDGVLDLRTPIWYDTRSGCDTKMGWEIYKFRRGMDGWD